MKSKMTIAQRKAMVEEQTRLFAKYMVEENSTIRKTAKFFGASKSTVHKYLAVALINLDKDMYLQVRRVINKNKEERYLRGGAATKEKYVKIRNKA